MSQNPELYHLKPPGPEEEEEEGSESENKEEDDDEEMSIGSSPDIGNTQSFPPATLEIGDEEEEDYGGFFEEKSETQNHSISLKDAMDSDDSEDIGLDNEELLADDLVQSQSLPENVESISNDKEQDLSSGTAATHHIASDDAHDHSEIFVDPKTNSPLEFYVSRFPKSDEISKIICDNGGKLLKTPHDGGIVVTYMRPDQLTPTFSKYRVYTVDFIRQCKEQGKLLSLEKHNLMSLHRAVFDNASSSSSTGLRKEYTMEEDCNMLQYVRNNETNMSAKGDKLWIRAKNASLSNHSWQSMKQRYKTVIMEDPIYVRKLESKISSSSTNGPTHSSSSSSSSSSSPPTPTPTPTPEPSDKEKTQDSAAPLSNEVDVSDQIDVKSTHEAHIDAVAVGIQDDQKEGGKEGRREGGNEQDEHVGITSAKRGIESTHLESKRVKVVQIDDGAIENDIEDSDDSDDDNDNDNDDTVDQYDQHADEEEKAKVFGLDRSRGLRKMNEDFKPKQVRNSSSNDDNNDGSEEKSANSEEVVNTLETGFAFGVLFRLMQQFSVDKELIFAALYATSGIVSNAKIVLQFWTQPMNSKLKKKLQALIWTETEDTMLRALGQCSTHRKEDVENRKRFLGI